MPNRLKLLLALSLVAIPVGVSPTTAATPEPPPGAASADSDGDGIPDAIETLDWYVAAGGSVDRKDVWVECDTMRRVTPSRPNVRRNARIVFDRAPVENPSSASGIALHVTFDDRLRFERVLGDGSFAGLYDRTMVLRQQNFDVAPFRGDNAETMRPYVHWCAFVNAINEQGTSGIAFDSTNPSGGIPGDTFLVSIGPLYQAFDRRAPETLRWEVGTFLHELGHNLGLTHGGAPPNRHTTFKPHYISVMNYHFQQGFVSIDDEGHLVRRDWWDYSRLRTSRLDERKLSEPRGVVADADLAAHPDGRTFVGLFRTCSPRWLVWFDFNQPIDFDCNGRIDATPRIRDLNQDGFVQNLGRLQNDWDNLILGAGAAAAAVGESLLVEEELTLEQAFELERELSRARPASAAERPLER